MTRGRNSRHVLDGEDDLTRLGSAVGVDPGLREVVDQKGVD